MCRCIYIESQAALSEPVQSTPTRERTTNQTAPNPVLLYWGGSVMDWIGFLRSTSHLRFYHVAYPLHETLDTFAWAILFLVLMGRQFVPFRLFLCVRVSFLLELVRRTLAAAQSKSAIFYSLDQCPTIAMHEIRYMINCNKATKNHGSACNRTGHRCIESYLNIANCIALNTGAVHTLPIQHLNDL